MNEITSAQNPLIKALRALKDKKAREEQGLMLVEGEKLMREALCCGLAPAQALCDRDQAPRFAPLMQDMQRAGAQVYAVPGHLLEAVCDTRTPQGACAAFSLPGSLPREALPDRLVALDGVQDPGNVGTIWRTCDAAGIQGLLLTGECADPFSPKVQRAAMGSGFRVGARMCDDLAEELSALQARGYAVIASSLQGEPFYEALPRPDRFVLVIGNEARGVSAAVQALSDVRVCLPMRGGAESLNAAVAAGIMMYELTRGLPDRT